MKQLVIDTKRWLRGKDAWMSDLHAANNSRLLRPNDNKMCCLGFYLRSVGVPEEAMLNLESPKMVVKAGIALPEEAAWLVCSVNLHPVEESPTCMVDSEECSLLMRGNDDREFTEEYRRAKVTELFARNGVEVIFQD